MNIQRSNTILYCKNWLACVEFYQFALGLSVTVKNDWFVEFQLTPTSFLSVANGSRATRGTIEGRGLTITLQVENVDAARRQLEQKQIEAGKIESRWGSRSFFVFDPEGNRLEFWQ